MGQPGSPGPFRRGQPPLSSTQSLPYGDVGPELPVFSLLQEKPEMGTFIRNFLIFKRWQIIQIVLRTLNGPHETCLLGWLSAHRWPASSSAAEPQQAAEGSEAGKRGNQTCA